MAKAVEQQEEWSQRKEILLSMPGVGNTLVYTLLADLPELGELSNKEIAALAGLALMNRDSGNLKRKRRIKGGRHTVRTTLSIKLNFLQWIFTGLLCSTYRYK